MAEETVILNLQVDQGQAERQLEKIEGILLDNKKAVQDLQAAYKKGTITQEEYVKENIRLQQNIKKEQDQKKVLIRTIETESNSRNALKNRVSQLTKEYDSLNTSTATGIKRADQLEKELAQLNAQLTKGDKSAGLFKNQIGNYPEAFKNAANSINIAGHSVGDIGTRIASLANPVTAAVGLLGSLATAYAKSTIGAKDLEFAQNQVASAFSLATNAFAEFISSAEDGEGIVSQFTNEIIAKFGGREAANVTKFLAQLQEDLQDLGRDEIAIRSEANQLIEQNQDLLEKVADDQLTINERLAAANQVEVNLRKNKEATLAVLVKQLSALQVLSKASPSDENLLTAVAQKRAEITKEGSTQEKQITRINKQQADLNQKLKEELDLRVDILRTDIFEANAPESNGLASLGEVAGGDTLFLDDPVIQASQARNEQFLKDVKVVEQTEEQKREAYLKTQEIQNIADQQRFNVLQDVAQAGAALFGEQTAAYKAFASASTIISTYSTATKAYESAFLPVPTVASPALGAISAGAAIALGLANLARINGVQFAEGGFTGVGGKYEAAGIVHKGEYVVPQSVNYSPAARPHINALESMRTRGYADGGFVANQSTAPINQSLIIGNMLKNMPPVFASWTEGQRVGNRLRFKENLSSLQTKPRRE